jgi:hypothetical protein
VRNRHEAFDFAASRFIHVLIRKACRDHAYFTLLGRDHSLLAMAEGAPFVLPVNHENQTQRTKFHSQYHL